MAKIIIDEVDFAALIAAEILPPPGSYTIGIDTADNVLKKMDSFGVLSTTGQSGYSGTSGYSGSTGVGGVSVVFTHFNTVGNSGTSETILYSDLVTASLGSNGNTIDALYAGTFTGGAGINFTVNFYIGPHGNTSDTLIFGSGLIGSSPSVNDWRMTMQVMRDSTSSVRISGVYAFSNSPSSSFTEFYQTVSGLSFATAQYLTVTGISTGSSNQTNVTMGKGFQIP